MTPMTEKPEVTDEQILGAIDRPIGASGIGGMFKDRKYSSEIRAILTARVGGVHSARISQSSLLRRLKRLEAAGSIERCGSAAGNNEHLWKRTTHDYG